MNGRSKRSPPDGSNKLAKAWNCGHDTVEVFVPGFLTHKADEFAGDTLYLAHAQSGRHEATADTHNPARSPEHSPARLSASCFYCLCRARKPRQEIFYLVGRTFSSEKIENNSNCPFSDRPLNPYNSDDPVDELLHIASLILPRQQDLSILRSPSGEDNGEANAQSGFAASVAKRQRFVCL